MSLSDAPDKNKATPTLQDIDYQGFIQRGGPGIFPPDKVSQKKNILIKKCDFCMNQSCIL